MPVSRWKKLTVAAGMLGLSVAPLAACGDSGSGGGSDDALEITYVGYDLKAAPIQQFLTGLKAGAKKYGYKLTAVSAEANPEKANTLMKLAVTKKADIILTDSFDPAALASGFAAAHAAKVPIYMQWAYEPAPDGVVWINSPNLGPAPTDAMIEEMGGEGSVLAWTLPQGRPCVIAGDYMEKTVGEQPGIELTTHNVSPTGWAQDARVTTQAWLVTHPEGSGNLSIWGCFDGPNVGAVAALQAAGRTDVKVYGEDAIAPTIQLVADGTEWKTWWFGGETPGAAAMDQIHANEGKAYDDLELTVSKQEPVEINQDNVEQFIKDHPEVMEGAGG
jgi:ribose transport system substrate-binding protein